MAQRTLRRKKPPADPRFPFPIDDALRNALPLIHRHINYHGVEEEWELTGTIWRLRKTQSATGQRDTPTEPAERGRTRSPRRRSRPESIRGLRSWTYSTPRSGSRARRSSYRWIRLPRFLRHRRIRNTALSRKLASWVKLWRARFRGVGAALPATNTQITKRSWGK